MNDRTFFITTVTANRRPLFRHPPTANLFLETLLHYRDAQKYLLHEFVVMLDHIHLLITPASDLSLERAVQFIKGGFSFRLKSRFPVWQESFTNHRIRSFDDYQAHRDYILGNPVRARLSETPETYPLSSARSLVRLDPMPPGLKPVINGELTRR